MHVAFSFFSQFVLLLIKASNTVILWYINANNNKVKCRCKYDDFLRKDKLSFIYTATNYHAYHIWGNSREKILSLNKDNHIILKQQQSKKQAINQYLLLTQNKMMQTELRWRIKAKKNKKSTNNAKTGSYTFAYIHYTYCVSEFLHIHFWRSASWIIICTFNQMHTHSSEVDIHIHILHLS